MTKLGHQNSETPEPINIQFGVGDYIDTKTQINRPSGGVPAHG